MDWISHQCIFVFLSHILKLFFIIHYFHFLHHHFFQVNIKYVGYSVDLFLSPRPATNLVSVGAFSFHLVSAGQPIHRGNPYDSDTST